MIPKLVAMYEKGEITADHLVVESLNMLDPANPAPVLEALPNDILQRMLKYAREYRPGEMRANYGLQPTIDQVAAAKKWIEDNVSDRGVSQTLTFGGNELTIRNLDPWLAASVGRSSTSKKVARLAGKEPDSGKVHVLIRLRDSKGGRAIYLYNLVKGEMRHIPQPSDEVWNQYSKLGVQIPHPNIAITDVSRWVLHGMKEAKQRGLKVEE